jgi:hypothetical protein
MTPPAYYTIYDYKLWLYDYIIIINIKDQKERILKVQRYSYITNH